MMFHYAEIYCLLLLAHWLCDYPLQGEFLSRAKADFASGMRVYHLVVHAGIQAGGVLIVTGSMILFVGELTLHAVIDEMKIRGLTNYGQDQALHIFCKIAWVTLLVLSGGALP